MGATSHPGGVVLGIKRAMNALKYTPLHPQWLANRAHRRARQGLSGIAGKRILDLGSGDNDYRSSLALRNEVISLDYPETNRSYTGRPDVFGDGRQLPFANAQFDVVLCFEVIEHVDGYLGVIEEASRVLRGAGGVLWLSAPFMYPLHDEPFDFLRFTAFRLDRDLTGCGLSSARIEAHGNSITTACQLFNLAWLDTVREWAGRPQRRYQCAALGLAIAVTPLVLTANCVGGCAELFRLPKALTLGYTVQAIKA